MILDGSSKANRILQLFICNITQRTISSSSPLRGRSPALVDELLTHKVSRLVSRPLQYITILARHRIRSCIKHDTSLLAIALMSHFLLKHKLQSHPPTHDKDVTLRLVHGVNFHLHYCRERHLNLPLTMKS